MVKSKGSLNRLIRPTPIKLRRTRRRPTRYVGDNILFDDIIGNNSVYGSGGFIPTIASCSVLTSIANHSKPFTHSRGSNQVYRVIDLLTSV